MLHELRNPLVGIEAAARVLARELAAHPGAKRASAIASEARHLLAMLESVADAEAAAAGRLRSQARSADLAALVRECVASLHLEGRVVTVAGVEDPLIVSADRGRIRQVLTNLLMNAAQYSPEGTPIDVVVRSDAKRGSASVEVHDRGPGIPPAERRKLFRKFTRLSTAEGTRGSGLGLYICKAIIEEHGGTIGHKGNAFTFALPLKRSARASASPARVRRTPRR
jgi:signal transduction histidine kinase